MGQRIVIIGGVAGGMSAAARLARLMPEARITVLERSAHVSYANCGQPYFVGGVIANEGDLLLAEDLADFELAYAAPFGSAKDPVNMLGYVAQNRLSGQGRCVSWRDVEENRTRGHQLVDVRSRAEFARGAIPGALNIPVDEVRERLEELDQKVVVFCQVGVRAYVATSQLLPRGYDAVNLDGGYLTWRNSPAFTASSTNQRGEPPCVIASPVVFAPNPPGLVVGSTSNGR
ncbi:MAG: hypothetical protein HIU57_09850 [Acidobacteria bacterium]|nr:hypothetical protein [Acidobacteriota bacterium]